MKKTLLSLALALALCLGLTVPALAWESNFSGSSPYIAISMDVGDTEATDAQGYTYRFSNPVMEVVDGSTIYYKFPVGTVITVQAPDGTPGKFTSARAGEGFEGWDDSSYTLYWDLEYELNRVAGEEVFTLYILGVDPDAPAVPVVTVENIPASGTAYPSAQTVLVDGRPVEFQMYALLDENGNPTNYIKLRDLASVLNGTAAQFSIDYDGVIYITTGEAYAPVGTEMYTPFSGERFYTGGAASIPVDDFLATLTAITLTDDNGGDYNYFKLRDLGVILGFHVGWDGGVFIETGKPYAGE